AESIKHAFVRAHAVSDSKLIADVGKGCGHQGVSSYWARTAERRKAEPRSARKGASRTGTCPQRRPDERANAKSGLIRATGLRVDIWLGARPIDRRPCTSGP